MSGFLLMEATIAILISIVLSSIMVLYLGKSAALRSDMRARSHLLAHARATLEESQERSVRNCAAECTVHVRSVSFANPTCESIDLVIPPLASCVHVSVSDHERTLVLSSWMG